MLNMAGNVRGAMRPQGRSPPFLLIGLGVALCILGFNYWSLSYRNREMVFQIGNVQDQLRQSMSKRMTAERRGASVVDELKKCEGYMDRDKNEIARKESEVVSLSEQLRNKVTENTECETKLKEIDELKTNIKTCEENNIGINQELQKKKEELKAALQQTPVLDAERCKLCKGQWDEEKKNFLNIIEKVLGPTALFQLRDAGIDIGHFSQDIGTQHKVKPELPNQQTNVQAAVPPGQMGSPNIANGQVNPNPVQGQSVQAQQVENKDQQQPPQGQPIVNMDKTAQDKNNNNVIIGQPVPANPPETNELHFNGAQAQNAAANNPPPANAGAQNAAANNPPPANAAANNPPPANADAQNAAANNPPPANAAANNNLPPANADAQNAAANNNLPPANADAQNAAANNNLLPANADVQNAAANNNLPPANADAQNAAANNPPPANADAQNAAANNPPPANPEPQNFVPMANPVLGPVVNDVGGQQANQPPAGNQVDQPALPVDGVPAPQNPGFGAIDDKADKPINPDSSKVRAPLFIKNFLNNDFIVGNDNDNAGDDDVLYQVNFPLKPLHQKPPSHLSDNHDSEPEQIAEQFPLLRRSNDGQRGAGIQDDAQEFVPNFQSSDDYNVAGNSQILQGAVGDDSIDRMQHNMRVEDEKIMNQVKSNR